MLVQIWILLLLSWCGFLPQLYFGKSKFLVTDIVKKAKMWTCKMCGEKQSVMQEYARGSGKDCRLQVQKLNERKGSNELIERSVLLNTSENSINLNSLPVQEAVVIRQNDGNNKWLNYIENHQNDEEESNDETASYKVSQKEQIVPKKSLKRLSNNKSELKSYCNALRRSPLKDVAITNAETDVIIVNDNNFPLKREKTNKTDIIDSISFTQDDKIKQEKCAYTSKWFQFIEDDTIEYN